MPPMPGSISRGPFMRALQRIANTSTLEGLMQIREALASGAQHVDILGPLAEGDLGEIEPLRVLPLATRPVKSLERILFPGSEPLHTVSFLCRRLCEPKETSMHRQDHSLNVETDPTARWIVAIARLDSLPQLRAALRTIEPLSVTTSVATSWDCGQELRYRGELFCVDEPVVRLEISCLSRQTDRVLDAIHKVFEQPLPGPGPTQHVVALR